MTANVSARTNMTNPLMPNLRSTGTPPAVIHSPELILANVSLVVIASVVICANLIIGQTVNDFHYKKNLSCLINGLVVCHTAAGVLGIPFLILLSYLSDPSKEHSYISLVVIFNFVCFRIHDVTMTFAAVERYVALKYPPHNRFNTMKVTVNSLSWTWLLIVAAVSVSVMVPDAPKRITAGFANPIAILQCITKERFIAEEMLLGFLPAVITMAFSLMTRAIIGPRPSVNPEAVFVTPPRYHAELKTTSMMLQVQFAHLSAWLLTSGVVLVDYVCLDYKIGYALVLRYSNMVVFPISFFIFCQKVRTIVKRKLVRYAIFRMCITPETGDVAAMSIPSSSRATALDSGDVRSETRMFGLRTPCQVPVHLHVTLEGDSSASGQSVTGGTYGTPSEYEMNLVLGGTQRSFESTSVTSSQSPRHISFGNYSHMPIGSRGSRESLDTQNLILSCSNNGKCLNPSVFQDWWTSKSTSESRRKWSISSDIPLTRASNLQRSPSHFTRNNTSVSRNDSHQSKRGRYSLPSISITPPTEDIRPVSVRHGYESETCLTPIESVASTQFVFPSSKTS